MILKDWQRVDKPWGYFERFTLNQPSTVKLLCLNKNDMLSLQSHQNRDEYWRVISGSGIAILDEKTIPLREGNELFINKGTRHRLSAGMQGIQILEISFGDFSEDDITRFEDKYNRPIKE